MSLFKLPSREKMNQFYILVALFGLTFTQVKTGEAQVTCPSGSSCSVSNSITFSVRKLPFTIPLQDEECSDNSVQFKKLPILHQGNTYKKLLSANVTHAYSTCTLKPDLTVQILSVAVPSVGMYEGILNFHLRVCNNGLATSPNSSVDLALTTGAITASCFFDFKGPGETIFVPSLESGTCLDLGIGVTPIWEDSGTLAGGFDTAVAMVDPTCSISETNDRNNTSSTVSVPMTQYAHCETPWVSTSLFGTQRAVAAYLYYPSLDRRFVSAILNRSTFGNMCSSSWTEINKANIHTICVGGSSFIAEASHDGGNVLTGRRTDIDYGTGTQTCSDTLR